MTLALSNVEREELFRTWVREYSDMLFSHAVFRGFDHSSARDFVQETFLSAWRSMDRFEGKASAKNWLFVILKNKITDHYRANCERVKTSITDYDTQFDEAGHWESAAYPRELTIDPTEATERIDFHQILDGCSGRLNDVQKAVFFMKYMEDLESEEICVRLSITPNNYWTLLHRAKVQLRACIEKHWFLSEGV